MPCAYKLDSTFISNILRTPVSAKCPFEAKDEELLAGSLCRFHAALGQQKGEDFNDVIFRYIDDCITTSQPVLLSGVQFPDDISFERYSDDRPMATLFLNQAVFGGRTSFHGARCKGELHFESARFKEELDFTYANVLAFASFNEVIFTKNAIFDGSRFEKGASFDAATFSGESHFGPTRFSELTAFTRTRFHGDAIFSFSTIGPVFFSGAEFYSDAYFIGVHFTAGAGYMGTSFRGDAVFEGSIFKGPVDFSCAQTEGDETLSTFRRISFYGAEFHDQARFTNRRFLDSTDFRGMFFTLAPEFYNCVLHQDTDFTGRVFLDRIGSSEVDAVRAYRTLKLAMENVRAWPEQGQFFAYEQQSLRRRKDTRFWVKVFSWCYEKTANYGQSFMLPVAWFFGTLVFFFLVYLGFHEDSVITWSDIADTAWLTLQQVFRPFQGFEKQSESRILVGVAALQTLLNLAFVTLFFLALRRRFKIG